VSGYPGDGAQRWPAVHTLDAAVLFRLVLEKAPAGSAWHAVSDQGDAVRDIATVIGRRLGLPVEAMPQETFGLLGPIFATDQPSSSAYTRQTLGWEPSHPSLLEDLENIQPLSARSTPGRIAIWPAQASAGCSGMCLCGGAAGRAEILRS